MYLATFCELADKPMWRFIFSQEVRMVSESQELCTAYFFWVGNHTRFDEHCIHIHPVCL